MFTYQKFLIGDTDRFDSFNFPKLEASLEQVVAGMATETSGPKAAMLISFVKDHSISSQSVKDHPALAALISSKTLPLETMEALFESSRNNQPFRTALEEYIKSSLQAGQIQPAVS